MDALYELFCMPTAPSLTTSEINKANFQELLTKTMSAPKAVVKDANVNDEATSRMQSVVGSKSHSQTNTLKTIQTMFEAAIHATEFERDRCRLEWLQTCVTTAIQMNFDGGAGGSSGGKKATANGGRKSKKSNEDDAFVVPDNDDEDQDEHYERIGASDDDYVPSDENEDVQKVPTATRRQRRNEAAKKVPAYDFEIPEGAGPKAVAKHFGNLPAVSSARVVLQDGYFARSFFFPNKESFNAFISVLNSATKTLDICVFSLTDDDVADALIAAKKRNVKVRIITDNQQAAGKGADAERLQKDHGIPYKTDHTTGYMHNKFAIVDSATLINGSFNWSKGARFKNRENITICNIPALIVEFQEQFDALWEEF